MLQFTDDGCLTETEYDITEEPKSASLFTTGNGYMGVRGSFEEFGATKIQGLFIRGLIDEIVEIVEPFCDNIYMRKYYFDEEKLKKFDKQDSCINLADILLIRFKAGDRFFYPWEGKILSWKRTINPSDGILTREVEWDDGEGNITKFRFERFASYADEHKYFLRAEAIPKNHALPMEIISGVDTNVRTNGQIVTSEIASDVEGGIFYEFSIGKKYGFTASEYIKNKFVGEKGNCTVLSERNDGLLYERAVFPNGGKCSVEKAVYISTSRDEKTCVDALKAQQKEEISYEKEKNAHIAAWKKLFENFDVVIKGDKTRDAALRYANYQTVISAPLDGCVHSIAAKGLTGEKYNQFVWWDCEIYQLPIFTYAYPQVTKNALGYRYRLLDAARENAAKEGMRGARYPFVSSVDGKEHVWIYVRHPFLQVHITSDIAYCILHYYSVTGDREFMREQGMEMLAEICRYWADRVTPKDGKYHILNVTGTDEHHPYVNDDAYTNYCVKICLKGFLSLISDVGISEKAIEKVAFTSTDKDRIGEVCDNLYLPAEKGGLIPQFDGYFDLSETLEICGTGTGKNFQMKQSGLYHKSRIIKQPDVMLLFSYIDCDFSDETFKTNWRFYEKVCENSSSLTFSPHAICAAREKSEEKFLSYFDDSAQVDVKDIFGTAFQGLHSGCMAGAWFSVLKGIFNVRIRGEKLYIDPFEIACFKSVALPMRYRGARLVLSYDEKGFRLENRGDKSVEIVYKGTEYTVDGDTIKIF